MLYIFCASCLLHASWKTETCKLKGVGEINLKGDQHHLQSVQDCMICVRRMEVLRCAYGINTCIKSCGSENA